MNHIDCAFCLFLVNQHGDFNFAGGNHADIDVVFAQSFKHFCGNSGIGEHSCADNRDFGNIVFKYNFFCADNLSEFLGDF